ncbi:VirK family protein [Bradyrhizobium ottawaense]|uniref:VirK family protein n=1 Tax=Bradyrhizobium ottawaense TaxID=931866 RepID=UPI00351369EE
MKVTGRGLTILLSLLSAASAPARADDPSPKYTEVLRALQAGKNVKLILDMTHCTNADGGKPASATQAGLVINAFRVDQPERHQLRQCSSNGRQLRTCRDRVHPP